MSVRAIRLLALVAAVLLGACDSKGSPTAGSRPGARSTDCTSQDAHRQRSSTMPVPQRATSPVQLGPGITVVGGHSPDLLPAPQGVVPKVTASTAWQIANLPRVGGGTAAIVLGTYPGEVPGSPSPVAAWLVYAAGVAIANGYPLPGAPVYGIKGTCAFGYVVVYVDGATGKVLQEGYDLNP